MSKQLRNKFIEFAPFAFAAIVIPIPQLIIQVRANKPFVNSLPMVNFAFAQYDSFPAVSNINLRIHGGQRSLHIHFKGNAH